VILFFCFFSLLSLFSQQGKETKKEAQKNLDHLFGHLPQKFQFVGRILGEKKK
jgi:hypothetical protein